MSMNIGLLTTTTNNYYYDITHSFKIDSLTYHILGLRKDHPTYGNTYYIFNCPDCTQEQSNVSSKFLPAIRTTKSQFKPAIRQDSNSLVRQTSKPTNRTSPIASEDKTKSMIDIEQVINKMLKIEHQTLITSLRTSIKEENKALIQSIKEPITKAENETKTTIETKLAEMFQTQQQSMMDLFRREIKVEHERLFQSIKMEKENSRQETMKSMMNRDEVVRLFEEQKCSLESIYRKQIETIESSIDQFKQIVNIDINRELTPKLDQIRTIDKESQQTMSKTIESITLAIAQFKQNLERQETIWNGRSQHIIQEQSNNHQIAVDNSRNLSIRPTADRLHNINQISSSLSDQHLFKVSIKTPESVRFYAQLFIGDVEYPSKSHTLCQRDPNQADEVICYVAPPAVDGPYNVIIYAKTKTETTYRVALSIQIPGTNITQSIFFPYTFPSFEMYQCILIQPLQSFLRHNEHALIHMVIPNAHTVKIQNGNDLVVLNRNDFINGVLKKQVQVLGDVYVYGQWNNDTDAPICFFYVI